jgi:RecB family endonuclease NucS
MPRCKANTLEPGWRTLRHERSLDRVIADDLGLLPQTHGQGRRRLDCFVLADTGRAVVIELKRPGIKLGTEQLAQVQKYVYALERHYGRMSDASQQRRVEGLLVGSEIKPDDRAQFTDARTRITARTWPGWFRPLRNSTPSSSM